MLKNIGKILAVVALVGFMAARADARGGGHGGGHHGGGHHGGHHGSHHHSHHASHHNNHHNHHGNHHYAHSRIPSHYSWGSQPFSAGWYGNHPNAWRYNHPYANGWAAAGLGATTAWLGINALSPGYAGYPVENTTVYTSDNGSAPAQPTQTANAQPLPADQAGQLARSGGSDQHPEESFLPLGVYSLAAKGQTDASAMVQLAVSKDGQLRGSYYDVLSDEGHSIHGAVDKKTQRVAWTVVPNGKVVFETGLTNLTQESGPLSVHFENGQTREWTLARYEGEEPISEELKDEGTDATKASAAELENGEPRTESTRN